MCRLNSSAQATDDGLTPALVYKYYISMSDKFLLKFRGKDSPYGVSRRTLKALSVELHLTETMVVHLAISRFAKEVLPAYEPDEGPLTRTYASWLKRAAAGQLPKGKVIRRKSLFPGR